MNSKTNGETKALSIPWIRNRLLYDRNGTQIWTLLNEPDWIMKIHYSNIDWELKMLRLTAEDPCRHQIQMPLEPHARFGGLRDLILPNTRWGRDDVEGEPVEGEAAVDSDTGNGYWYVMRRYCVPNYDMLQSNWRCLGLHSLAFLEDLHRKYRRVHMDIKQANIFWDDQYNRFIVADYNLCTSPYLGLTEESGWDARWYYYRFGAIPTGHCVGYRMDLTMWAYMLMDLTWPFPDGHTPTFIRAFLQRRDNPTETTPTEEELFTMRSAAVERASPVIRQLLATIAAFVPWASPDNSAWKEPPPEYVYSALSALLC